MARTTTRTTRAKTTKSTKAKVKAIEESPPERPPRATPFPYRDYDEIRRLIVGAVTRGPVYVLLTGESGTGKTSLKDDVLAGLDPHHHLLYVSATRKSTTGGLTRFVARHFRVTPKRSHVETVADLETALRGQPATQALLWLDEADQLPLDTLNELRSLAESSGGGPLFSVVLSGLPELRTLIDSPLLFPLKRRIDLRCALRGLRRDELDAFLVHRFGSRERARLLDDVLNELFERSLGTPALLSKVVAQALLRAGDGAPVREEHTHAAFDALGL